VETSNVADAFLFQNLRQPSVLGHKLAQVSGARVVKTAKSPVIRLNRFMNWEDYAATLPKSLVSDQRRRWRRLREAVPGICFRRIEGSETIGPILEWITHHKSAWAQGKGRERVWFADKHKRSFLEAILPVAQHEGALMLATLAQDDEWIAAGWGFISGTELTLHAAAFHEAHAACAPTRLLLECLLRWCFEHGIATYDMMPGDEDYKRTWATDCTSVETVFGPLNWRGKLKQALARSIWNDSSHLGRAFRKLPHAVRETLQSRLAEYRNAVT
jgi:CelD/BcsL family acetyltransferase involved in cellulose biosynthesis